MLRFLPIVCFILISFAAPSRSQEGSTEGFVVSTLKPGDGINFPSTGDVVTVHYTGKLSADGRKFDSSKDRGEPFSFNIGVGEVIACWDEGVKRMSKGQVALLTCPPNMAYGSRGAGSLIPPDAELKFEVELIDFRK